MKTGRNAFQRGPFATTDADEFEAREEYKLATEIANASAGDNGEWLSTMPVEQLRQIAKWIQEHRG
jgi:hypothetical protein